MKKVKLITKILAVVLISAVSFIGIYTQVQNRMENQVKDYDLEMGLTGNRIVTLKVSDKTNEIIKDENGNVVKEEDKEEGKNYTTEEVAVNKEEDKTLENYEKSKAILEKRLKRFGVDNYIIKLDRENGKMVLELPEDSNTDYVVSNLSQVGKFEFQDSETEEAIMNNSDIKNANVLYSSQEKGTVVILSIEFDKKKLKEMTTEYKTIKDEEKEDSEEKTEEATSEENESEEQTSSEKTSEETTEEAKTEENKEEKQKKISMKIDDSSMITTSFDQVIENGKLQLNIGKATNDMDKLNESIKSAGTIATVLGTGAMPLEYEVSENQYISETITKDMIMKAVIIAAIVAAVALLYLIIRFKVKGILTSISYIGFVALYLLLIRYTNVGLTIEGLIGILSIFILNYVFNLKILSNMKDCPDKEIKDTLKKTYIEYGLRVIPICILSITFCFIYWIPIKSFGMVMFWGLALILIYNIIVAGKLFKKEESEVTKHEE